MSMTETEPDTGTGAEPGGDGAGSEDPRGAASEGQEKSIEEQAEEASEDEATGQQAIPGTVSKLTLGAGGNKPESSEMKMRGGSLPVDGEFAKGSRIRLVIEGVVAEVSFVDHYGKDNYVDGTVRRHMLRSVHVRRALEDE